jgi:hypothetical protein
MTALPEVLPFLLPGGLLSFRGLQEKMVRVAAQRRRFSVLGLAKAPYENSTLASLFQLLAVPLVGGPVDISIGIYPEHLGAEV